MSDFRPKWLVLHDYGGVPKGDAPFNPYNALVHNGKVIYRDPANPYGVKAPHAFGLNNESVGLSWGGPVGGTPSEDDLALLKAEHEKVKALYPGIVAEGHGEAYARTKGTPQQASKNGRDLIEASWRKALFGETGAPTQIASAPTQPPTMAARAMTAGHPNATSPQSPAPLPVANKAPPKTPEPGLFQTPGLAGLGKSIGAFTDMLGGGGEQNNDMSKALAQANDQGLSESERAAMAALDMVRKRERRSMTPRMGAFA